MNEMHKHRTGTYSYKTDFTLSASAVTGRTIFFSPNPLFLRRIFSAVEGILSCSLSERQTKDLVIVRSRRKRK